MKIVLSTEAIHPPLAGIGRYTWELATRLPQHAEISSVLYMSDGGWCDLPNPELPTVTAAVIVPELSNDAVQVLEEPAVASPTEIPPIVPISLERAPISEPVLNYKGRIRKQIETLYVATRRQMIEIILSIYRGLRDVYLAIYRRVEQMPGFFIRLKQSLRHRLGQIPTIARVYGKLMPMRATNHLDKIQGAIFHGPNYFVPKTHLPCVVTIHDLSIYRFPQWHPQARIDRMREAIPQAIERASLIIAISEATRLEVIQTFNLPPERVRTVLLGVDAIYHPRTEDELAPILSQFDLRVGGYTFFVSTIEPRKNLRHLIAAYGLLPLEVRMKYPLVLVGGSGWQSEDIHVDIRAASEAGWLKYLGFAEQKYLPAFYAGARLFAYPSWYEGFGLPIAEAMASGVPVVTSNNSSMPEVAAGAALLVDPANVEGIRDQLFKGLLDESWRAFAIQRGLQRAAELSWDACVENTVKAYQSIQRK